MVITLKLSARQHYGVDSTFKLAATQDLYCLMELCLYIDILKVDAIQNEYIIQSCRYKFMTSRYTNNKKK